MKKIVLAFVALITLSSVAFAAAPSVRSENLSTDKMREQNETLVKMVVEEISKKLPQKVDNYTNFTKISNNDLTLIYTFEIDTGKKSDAEVIKQSKDKMQKVIKRGICISSKRFLDSDINISYKYLNAKTKSKLFQFNVTKKDCLGIK